MALLPINESFPQTKKAITFIEVDTYIHDIYLGTDEYLVEQAGKGSAEYLQSINNNIYTPGQMEPGITYYWRVDAVLDNGIVRGHVWEFTVEKYP